MTRWQVEFHPAFAAEMQELPEAVQDEVLALASAIVEGGPQMGRPRVDTLNGSKHANMKEGRFRAAGGAWRVAFVFDVERRAVLLVGGNKAGVAQKRFYRQLIARADNRFDEHLAAQEAGK